MKKPISNVYNLDCMEGMKQFPDKFFDLAVVDPEYGIDVGNMNMGLGTSKRCSKAKNRKWKPKDWDKKPPGPEYFAELFRVSKNQIIWGGNYFKLPTSQYFAIWDKGEGMYGRSFAECEYAWVSSGGTRIFKINPVQKERIHPTQKPLDLYLAVYKNYLPNGGKVIDTHLGSQSNRIAAYKRGNIDFWAYETDPDYFNDGNARFEKEIAMPLFDTAPIPVQLTI